jgi:hypothetical protein
MPLGPFPFPDFDTPPDPAREPSTFWARMRTRWRRSQLDDELSAGADPRASAELSERASQLRSDPVRTRLANTLVALWSPAVPVSSCQSERERGVPPSSETSTSSSRS